MKTTPSLRLDSLTLRNFRCFAECKVSLHPEITVLVAENGGGKTAIMDAIRIALGPFVDTVSATRQGADLGNSDIRLALTKGGVMKPALPAVISANGQIFSKEVVWTRTLNRVVTQVRKTAKGAEALRELAKNIRGLVAGKPAHVAQESTILPLVAYYGVDRLWNEQRLNERQIDREMIALGQMAGYSGCLSLASSASELITWYETKMLQAGDRSYSGEHPERLLAAVEAAMQVVLEPTGWCQLEWDIEKKTLFVKHADQGRLPISFLSAGVRTMVALVIDIARRCATLNPHLGIDAAKQTPGILLVDEIDLHLHPRWQQQIVDLLRQAFPALQLVLSTHSPHVLSTVDAQCIRMIRVDKGEGQLETPRYQTRGVESADVLATIMGVDPIPQVKEARMLSAYHALIQENRIDGIEARDLRDRLEEHFGRSHPVILDCDRMIRLERFKQSLPIPRSE